MLMRGANCGSCRNPILAASSCARFTASRLEMFVRPGIPIAPAAAGVPETLLVGRPETGPVCFASPLVTVSASTAVFAFSFFETCVSVPVVPSLLSCARKKIEYLKSYIKKLGQGTENSCDFLPWVTS